MRRRYFGSRIVALGLATTIAFSVVNVPASSVWQPPMATVQAASGSYTGNKSVQATFDFSALTEEDWAENKKVIIAYDQGISGVTLDSDFVVTGTITIDQSTYDSLNASTSYLKIQPYTKLGATSEWTTSEVNYGVQELKQSAFKKSGTTYAAKFSIPFEETDGGELKETGITIVGVGAKGSATISDMVVSADGTGSTGGTTTEENVLWSNASAKTTDSIQCGATEDWDNAKASVYYQNMGISSVPAGSIVSYKMTISADEYATLSGGYLKTQCFVQPGSDWEESKVAKAYTDELKQSAFTKNSDGTYSKEVSLTLEKTVSPVYQLGIDFVGAKFQGDIEVSDVKISGNTSSTDPEDPDVPDNPSSGEINFQKTYRFTPSDYDEGGVKEQTLENITTSYVPKENCYLQFDLLIPAANGKPSFSNVIKPIGTMLIGDQKERVQQADADNPDVKAEDFDTTTTIDGTKYYKATVKLPFGEMVSANVGSTWTKGLDFGDAVTGKLNGFILKIASWQCDYSGTIAVANAKFVNGTGHVEVLPPVVDDGTTGDPTSAKPDNSKLFVGTSKTIEDFSSALVNDEKEWKGETGYQYSAGKTDPFKKDGVAAESPYIAIKNGMLNMYVDFSKDLGQSWSEVKSRVYYSKNDSVDGTIDIDGYNAIAYTLVYPTKMGNSIRTNVYAKNSNDEPIIDQEGDLRLESVKELKNGWSCATVVATISDSSAPLQYLSLGIAGPYKDLGQVYYDDVRAVNLNPELDFVKITEKVASNPGTPDISGMPNSVKLVSSNPTKSTVALASYLRGLQEDDKVLFGHQNSIFRSVKTNGKTSDIYEITGNEAGVCGIDSLALTGKEMNTTSADEALANSVAVAKKAAKAGSIVTLSCHMPNFGCDKITQNSDGSYNFTQCDFSESKLLTPSDCADEILDGGKYNAQFTAYLDIIADFANQLGEDGIPVMFRPFHENTGNWFWWGTGITSDSYKAMWRYMVDYLEAKGVNNLLYIYSPNGPISSVEEYGDRYPGDQYVDIVAFDYYNDYASLTDYDVDSFFETMNASCAIVNSFAEAHGKIPAIAETGVRITAKGKDSLMISGNPTKDSDWYNKVIKVAVDNNMPYFLLWANFSSSNFFVPYKFNDEYGQEMINDFIAAYNNEDSIFATANKSAFYEKAVSKNITAETYANEVTGYLVEPKNFAVIKTATTLKAYVRNGDKTTVRFGVKASKTGEETFLTASRSGNNTYTAKLDSATLKSLGETGTGVVTVYAGTEAIGSAQFINFNQDAKTIKPPYFDDFETYYNDSELMESKFGSDNHAAGCSSSVSLSTHRNAGDNGMRFHYTLKYQGSEVWTGGYGHTLSTTDWSAYNGLSMWINPDGYGQKLVLQLVDSTGTEYEVNLSEYTKGTKAQIVTIPFSKIVSKKDATVSVPKDDIAAFKIWCNSIPENYKGKKDANGYYTVESNIYIDDIQAVKNAGSSVTTKDEDDLYVSEDIDEATQNVIDLIDAIGTVEYTEVCKEKIDAARKAYDALTTAQKDAVTNYADLEAAEARYEELQDGKADDADQKAADVVIDLIKAIGTVEDTDACKTKIDAARKAYDALTSEQQKLVTNYDVLTEAEKTYNELHKGDDADSEKDQAQAKAVIDLIDAIDNVDTSDLNAYQKAIDTAKKQYNALTPSQKTFVPVEKLDKLVAAEADYAQKRLEEENAAAQEEDKAAAKAVVDLINAIGVVSYPDSKADIENAYAAYDALSANAKVLVSEEMLYKLAVAKADYAQLKLKAEQEKDVAEADLKAASQVVELIRKIGIVEYTDASKAAIDAARKAYDGLTADQKKLISSDILELLVSAENTYEQKEAAEKADAEKKAQAEKKKKDEEKARDAISKIDAIGTVSTASKAKIDAARKAYDALTADQKKLVSAATVKKLTDAEAAYKKAEADDAAMKAKPKKVSLKSVKKKGSRKVVVKWKKVSGASGYQIAMKTGKGKYKVVKTIKSGKKLTYTKSGLKKYKKYTFKVRAYKVVAGKKVYGAYSKTKKITLK